MSEKFSSGTKNPKQNKKNYDFLSYCPSLMHGICIRYVQHRSTKFERGVYELAHTFIHFKLLGHLSYPGDYWYALASIIRLHLLKNYWTNLYQISYVAFVRRVKKYEIVNFMTSPSPQSKGR